MGDRQLKIQEEDEEMIRLPQRIKEGAKEEKERVVI